MSRRASGRVEPPRPPGSLFTSTRRDQFTRFPTLDERTLSRQQGAELRDWLVRLAVVTDQPFPLMGALMNERRRRHLLVPRFRVLERLVRSARVRADQHTYGLLNLPLKGELAERGDALLSPQGEEAVSRFVWLARPVGAPSRNTSWRCSTSWPSCGRCRSRTTSAPSCRRAVWTTWPRKRSG